MDGIRHRRRDVRREVVERVGDVDLPRLPLVRGGVDQVLGGEIEIHAGVAIVKAGPESTFSTAAQRAVQFGVNNYLVKPFTTQILKEKIEAVFGPLE